MNDFAFWAEVKGYVVAIVGGLVTAVGFLTRILVATLRKHEQRFEAQEAKLEAQQEVVVDLTAQVHEQKGRQAGIEQMSAAVLETVHKAAAGKIAEEP